MLKHMYILHVITTAMKKKTERLPLVAMKGQESVLVADQLYSVGEALGL